MYGWAKVSTWPFKYGCMVDTGPRSGCRLHIWDRGAGENRGIERRPRDVAGKNEKKKKVRWKRMYVGHVAAGIASMCHRGNHAGNAEAHLTTLPPCIYLPSAIPYIFTVSVPPQTVLPLSSTFSHFLSRSVFRFSYLFYLFPLCHCSARTSKKFARRGNPNAKIRKARAVLAF